VERAVKVPIRFLGTGEGLDDLEIFEAERYAHRLVSQ
jgi:signal recognition particle GTPase